MTKPSRPAGLADPESSRETRASQEPVARAASRRPEHAGEESGARRPSDVSSLLLELGRAIKARRFYPSGDPELAATVDRSFRALRCDIDRLGPLELEIRDGGFRLAGAPAPIGRGTLDELARELEQRAVHRLRFDPSLQVEAFRTLIQILAADADRLTRAGGVVRALYPRIDRGIRINGVALGPDRAPEPGAAGGGGPPATPPRPAPASGASAPSRDRVGRQAAAPAAPDDAGSERVPEASMSDAVELYEVSPRAAGRVEPADRGDPTDAERASDPVAELYARLRRLDARRGTDDYRASVRDVTMCAAALAEVGLGDAWFEALRRLSIDAGEGAEHDPAARRIALEGVRDLAAERHLPELIRRACADDPESSVRAVQILIQIGARPVPELLRQLEAEPDVDRRARMNGILIAMGERASPELLRAIEEGDRRRARVAARLAGEIQNPEAVRPLRGLLLGTPHEEVRKEAAKALVRIGGPAAVEVLIEALASRDASLAQLAAFCLGATGSVKASEALVGAVRRAARDGALALAREAIRSLGRLQRREAAPELAAILRQRTLFGRRRLRDLKVAAAGALGQLPGREAEEALRYASRAGDAQVRRAARQALARRR